MTYIIISTLVLIIAGIVLAKEFEGEFLGFLGCIMVVVGFVGCVAIALLSWEWVASKYKADIINAEYGTDYTREQVYYASSVIETIRELQRQRIEVNGDLMRDQ